MDNHVLKINHVTKHYKETTALTDVNLTLKPGGIYGFIGQNGAGKTTLIRLIMGLSILERGKIELFGSSDEKGLQEGRKSIGCMVEHSGLFGHLTARQNLEILRQIKGISDVSVIDEVLSIVNLLDTGKKKFKDFSMGMKQRLGIAAALLGKPKMLILDEPVNGLDPLGIIEIRETLQKINKTLQVTMLISSHLLSELYMLATDYIIIDQGRIVNTYTLQELNEACKSYIILQTNDLERAKIIIEEKLNVKAYKVTEDQKIHIYDTSVSNLMIAKAFNDAKMLITELTFTKKSLESFFVDLIGGSAHA